MTGLGFELPMFPLGTVLLPSTAMSLHVFEDRYRALARHCMDGDRRLGVVLIERGSEVGGGDVRFDVGTRARIDDAVELDDGRWVMILLGEDRIRVKSWLPDDPYPRAEVVVCEEGPIAAEAGARRYELESVLREVHDLQVQLGDIEGGRDLDLAADAVVATWQAVAQGPLGPLDAQRILATDGPAARLDLAVSLLAEEAAVLAQRLGGG
jgi:ATP-dependent Lon protease